MHALCTPTGLSDSHSQSYLGFIIKTKLKTEYKALRSVQIAIPT